MEPRAPSGTGEEDRRGEGIKRKDVTRPAGRAGRQIAGGSVRAENDKSTGAVRGAVARVRFHDLYRRLRQSEAEVAP